MSPAFASFDTGRAAASGALLVIFGCLSISFNVIDIALTRNVFGDQYDAWYEDVTRTDILPNGYVGYGFWAGVLVSWRNPGVNNRCGIQQASLLVLFAVEIWS